MAFGRIWRHGKYSYGTCHLLTIWDSFKNDPKSRSVNIFQRLDFDPNRIKDFLSAKTPPRKGAAVEDKQE